jgi:mono/diheme cytochrome c family protein
MRLQIIDLAINLMPQVIRMKRSVDVTALMVLIASLASFQPAAIGQTSTGSAPAAGVPDQYHAMLTTYCFTCHNTRAKIGGLALDGLDLQAAADDARTWEKALRKLRGHLMPPPGNPQPPAKDVESFVAWMENTLDSHPQGSRAGYVPIQRLNRTEYAASVKALVGVDVNPKDVLPQDIQVDGFDNIADALSVSPAFLDQYVTAARHVAKLAIGDPTGHVSNVKYLIGANQNSAAIQNNEEPLPPGTRGGARFTYNFPADGQYRINIDDLSLGLYTSTVENESTLVILIDGKMVFRKSIGGPADLALADRKEADGRAAIMERFSKIPVEVQAGVHDVVVTFIDRAHVESDDNVAAGFGGTGVLGFGDGNNRMARLANGIEINGPFNSTGVSKTASRALIFVCDPKKIGEPACAKEITERLARRAYRRPVTAEDVALLMPFYEAGREGGGSFDQGIEQVVAAVLASPDFLYRAIRAPDGTSPNSEFTLTNLELASRLSFFLWNTGPDEELLTLASAGGLTKPGALEKSGAVEKQVRRMLADPKASSLVTSFAMKWLNLTTLDSVQPDPKLFPGFNEQLRHDFSKEAEAFISSILLEDRSVIELLTSDHTFLNEELARLYGVSGVVGPQFREVTVTERERAGLLGKGAVLLRTSYGDRTSPVLRGAWVLDKLLGTPPTPPPANTATDLSQKAGEAPKTVRARLEQHRNKASCNQCHGVIDPTGLALENFDAIGEWRTMDRQANAPIDAKTVLPNGVPINGVVDLRTQLVQRPATFAEAFTEKLMMYALNRQLEYFDMPQVRTVVRGAAKDNYKFSSIVLGIVNTDAFRRQGPGAAAKEDGVKLAAAK